MYAEDIDLSLRFLDRRMARATTGRALTSSTSARGRTLTARDHRSPMRRISGRWPRLSQSTGRAGGATFWRRSWRSPASCCCSPRGLWSACAGPRGARGCRPGRRTSRHRSSRLRRGRDDSPESRLARRVAISKLPGVHVLVTGVTGFVGHHLAAALLADGHQVTGIVRPFSAGPGAGWDVVREADISDMGCRGPGRPTRPSRRHHPSRGRSIGRCVVWRSTRHMGCQLGRRVACSRPSERRELAAYAHDHQRRDLRARDVADALPVDEDDPPVSGVTRTVRPRRPRTLPHPVSPRVRAADPQGPTAQSHRPRPRCTLRAAESSRARSPRPSMRGVGTWTLRSGTCRPAVISPMSATSCAPTRRS